MKKYKHISKNTKNISKNRKSFNNTKNQKNSLETLKNSKRSENVTIKNNDNKRSENFKYNKINEEKSSVKNNLNSKKNLSSNSENQNYIFHEDKKDSIRINKFISDSGYCSRREADKLIENGRVTVNGQKAVIGTKVFPYEKVYVDNKLIGEKESPVYIALNKPVGITCTTETTVKGNIVDFVGYPKRIFHIGRLDKDSQGLIFLTNDGDIVNKILRAGNNHEKEYIVTVDKTITNDFISKMSNGVKILGTVTKKCKVIKEGSHVFRIILTQGLNRQIRRMTETLGYTVVKLERVRIMNVTLENLPIGKWRYLTENELKDINRLISSSTKTEEGSKV